MHITTIPPIAAIPNTLNSKQTHTINSKADEMP